MHVKSKHSSNKKVERFFSLKRVIAIIILAILFLMILATLLVGILGGPDQKFLLFALIFSDIVIPVVLYAYIIITKQIHNLSSEQSTKDFDENPKNNTEI